MASSTLKIYSSWRSAASWRARTALHFKGLDYECIPVNLLKGEQHSPEFRKLNPLGFVPVLVDGDVVVADSFAIIMYLEDKYPQHTLLPQDLQKKALNYQVASVVTSSMQPLQNITILSYIEEKLGSDERFSWAHNHIKRGFAALEKLLKGHAGKYATGDEIALADLFLAPQLEGSERLNIDMAEFPELKRLKDAYSDVPALRNTAPEKQPDYLDDDKSPILGL